MDKKYTSVSDYLISVYGEKVYKVSLDGGFTCPNRDGTLGKRGCIFCSEGGSGEFSEARNLSITEQIERGKNRVISKMPQKENHKFIAYFQAFTNTYAPIDVLRNKFYEAINHPDIVILSIATRPDCISKEVLDLLIELNRIKPVWIELGLQTTNENSGKYIRRGYSLKTYDETVNRLKQAGILIITHVIIGLPGETKEDMLNTVSYVVATKTFGIKLSLLHVLKNTDLALEYSNGKFEILSLEEYVDIICDCVKIIPKEMVIHRLTGDGDKKLLIAPLWSADKKKVLNTLNKSLNEMN